MPQSRYNDEPHSSINYARLIRAGIAGVTAFGVVASAMGLRFVNIGQNESAIQTTNGVMTQDHVPEGRSWYFAPAATVDYPRISHTTQSFAITAVDKGQACAEDCVTLQTSDQQTVTGSLGIQWSIDRDDGSGGQSVAAELFNKRGATSIHDMQEKFLAPQFIDCMIEEINARTASALVENGKDVKKAIKECVVPRVRPFHIKVDDVLDRGFGPSPEARLSMRRQADARQDGQIAAIQLQTASARKEAAAKNADIFAGVFQSFVQKGIAPEQALELTCLADPNSRERPCVRYTASGAATGGFMPSVAAPAAPAPR